MNLWELVAVLRRRWYLAAVVVLVALGAGLAVSTVVKPSYQATSSVVLLPPKGGAAETVNPYLDLGNLGAAADVVVGALNTEQVREKVADLSADSEFLVSKDATASAPFVLVTVAGGDPSQTMRVMRALTDEVQTRLRELQQSAQVKESAFITSRVVSQDTKPTVVQKTRIRLVGLTTVVAFVAGLLVLVLLDGRMRRRRTPGSATRRRGGRPAPRNGREQRRPRQDARKRSPGTKPRPADGPQPDLAGTGGTSSSGGRESRP